MSIWSLNGARNTKDSLVHRHQYGAFIFGRNCHHATPHKSYPRCIVVIIPGKDMSAQINNQIKTHFRLSRSLSLVFAHIRQICIIFVSGQCNIVVHIRSVYLINNRIYASIRLSICASPYRQSYITIILEYFRISRSPTYELQRRLRLWGSKCFSLFSFSNF